MNKNSFVLNESRITQFWNHNIVVPSNRFSNSCAVDWPPEEDAPWFLWLLECGPVLPPPFWLPWSPSTLGSLVSVLPGPSLGTCKKNNYYKITEKAKNVINTLFLLIWKYSKFKAFKTWSDYFVQQNSPTINFVCSYVITFTEHSVFHRVNFKLGKIININNIYWLRLFSIFNEVKY